MWGHLINSLITSLVVSAVWIFLLRRYSKRSTKKYQALINEKTEALREIFYLMHHQGARKAMASVLGLLESLYGKESKELGENLTLLSRPMHHKYAKLASDQKGRMDEYVKKAATICREHFDSAAKGAAKFEHLQE